MVSVIAGGLSIFAAYFDHSEYGDDEIASPYFRSRRVAPFRKRDLVHDIPHVWPLRARSGAHAPRDDFDVENPSGNEGFLKQGRQARRYPEKFRAALCVINVHAKK